MSLSEHERRVLEQMELALHAEDPKLVSALRGADPRAHRRRVTARAGAGFLLGVAALLSGLIAGGPLIAVGVLGFVIMLVSAWFAVSSRRQASGGRMPGGTSPRANHGPGGRGVTDRFEERWRRRQDQG